MIGLAKKIIFSLCIASATTVSFAQATSIPLADGEYIFKHRYAEHPLMESFQLHARIKDGHISLTKEQPGEVFPAGLIAEGLLLFHPASGKWIIGESQADASAEDVGGCSEGPEVVDLEKRIYWTC